MGTRAFGVLAATLAVITGGIGGGAVAFAAFAPPADTRVIETVAAIERTRSPLQVQPAATTTSTAPTSGEETPASSGSTSPDAVADSATATSAPAAPAPATSPVAASVGGCAGGVSGSTPGAPALTSAGGVAGTTTGDLEEFAAAYNAVRIANCLQPVPLANVRYDTCMEQRLFWMAEDPSTDTSSAWGHIGSQRSDGVPSVGCDGNLAGGYNNVGTTFARKWWDSTGHRISVYNPAYTGSMANVCIYFAVTHGGVPDEPVAFARAAARWGDC